MGYDLGIVGGVVVTGTAPSMRADVAIDGGRIVAVGDLAGLGEPRARLEAAGRVVGPGFVDAHAHVELALLDDGLVPTKVGQGVTTEILGQDGLSYAPLSARRRIEQIDYLSTLNGRPRRSETWRSWPEFLRLLEGRVAQNVAFLVPYGAIRVEAAGWTAAPADPLVLDRIRSMVEEGLQAGAVGVSVGLDYFPQTVASTAELDLLSDLAARSGTVFVAHVRGSELGTVDAVREVIETGRRTGAAIHISHLRDASALPVLDAARADGLDVTFDVYPYRQPSTMLLSHLPTWVLDGGPVAIRRRLGSASTRARLRDDIARILSVEMAGAIISNLGRDVPPDMVGRSVASAVAAAAVAPEDGFAELLLGNDLEVGYVGGHGSVDEASLIACLSHPASMGGSDAILVGGRPHPRGAGATARWFGRYVRERGLLTVEQAFEKLSTAPARRFELIDRGTLAVGAAADVVILDPAVFDDATTETETRRPPIGLDAVLVGGAVVWREGRGTTARPGAIIRRD